MIECNCHGHSDECEYNAEVNERGLSLDIDGELRGGGVCQNCKHNTRGINCEKCKPFFYRPEGVDISDPNACQGMNTCFVVFFNVISAQKIKKYLLKNRYIYFVKMLFCFFLIMYNMFFNELKLTESYPNV